MGRRRSLRLVTTSLALVCAGSMFAAPSSEAGGLAGNLSASRVGRTSAVTSAGTLFFSANDGVHGWELWRSDGTTLGTTMVKDINRGGVGSYPRDLVNVSGTLFFRAYDPAHGLELWRSDGTTPGTILVDDIIPGSDSSFPYDITGVGMSVYFVTVAQRRTWAVWRSNGTAAGTVMLQSVGRSECQDPHGFIESAGVVYFTSCQRIWATDGTPGGTNLIRRFPQPSAGAQVYLWDPTAIGGLVYFLLDGEQAPGSLWRTDGTGNGTVLVSDTPDYAYDLITMGGRLYFMIMGTDGFQLWSSDGSSAAIIDPDVATASVYPWPTITAIGSTLWFTGEDGVHGQELWTSDGTGAGTALVKDISPGIAGSYPSTFTNVNGTVYFIALDRAHGFEVWLSDGTSDGTHLLKEITPGDHPFNDSYPHSLTDGGGQLFFSAYNHVDGRELWASDGTAEGTRIVSDISPGTSSSKPRNLCWVAS